MCYKREAELEGKFVEPSSLHFVYRPMRKMFPPECHWNVHGHATLSKDVRGFQIQVHEEWKRLTNLDNDNFNHSVLEQN